MEANKVVLVTGGARGIGKEIAKKFAKEGFNVVVNYVSRNTEIEPLTWEIKQQAKGKEIKVMAIGGDVTSATCCAQMIEQVKNELGRIDVLVNNAGITKDNLLMKMKEEEFDRVLEVNLKGTFQVSKQVIPIMIKQKKGKIINISSVVGIVGNAGQCNYAASKAGMIGFTKSLAKEVASRNILVNAVAPGFIKTDMTEVLKEEIKQEINKQIPLKRMGYPSEIANTVYFLGSDENSYITGQVLQVDGGMC